MAFVWAENISPDAPANAAGLNEIQTNLDTIYSDLGITRTGCGSGAGWTEFPMAGGLVTSKLSSQAVELRAVTDYAYENKCPAYDNNVETGYESGDQAGVDTGYNPGYRSNEHTNYESGDQVGVDTGYNPGYENDEHTGYKDSDQVGVDSSHNPGYENDEHVDFCSTYYSTQQAGKHGTDETGYDSDVLHSEDDSVKTYEFDHVT